LQARTDWWRALKQSNKRRNHAGPAFFVCGAAAKAVADMPLADRLPCAAFAVTDLHSASPIYLIDILEDFAPDTFRRST
jgi:hypothetical protein